MKHRSSHSEKGKVFGISLRELAPRDRRENRLAHEVSAQLEELSGKGDGRMGSLPQAFFCPHASPRDHGEGESGMTTHTVGSAHLGGVQSHQEFCVGKELLDWPSQGKALDNLLRGEFQVRRGEETRFAFAVGIPCDHDPDRKSRFRPPGDKRFDVQRDRLPIDVHAYPLPSLMRPGHFRQLGQSGAILGFSSPLGRSSLGRTASQDGIDTQAADQGYLHLGQRFQDRRIVVRPIGHQRNRKGNPPLDRLENLYHDLKAGAELGLGAGLLGSIQSHPEGNSHGNSKQLNHHGQNNPVVSPDIARTGTPDVIEERSGSENMLSPFGTQGVVDDDQYPFQLEGLDYQVQLGFEESLRTKLEMRKETVETAFVAFPCRPQADLANMPLSRLNQPRNRHRRQVRPTPLGKRDTTTEDNLGKLRCTSVMNHGLSPLRELTQQLFASGDGPFFLSIASCQQPSKCAKGQLRMNNLMS